MFDEATSDCWSLAVAVSIDVEGFSNQLLLDEDYSCFWRTCLDYEATPKLGARSAIERESLWLGG